MSNSLLPDDLAWLRQCAAVEGNTYDRLLLHLLERVESLEARPIPGEVELVPSTPEAAPKATLRNALLSAEAALSDIAEGEETNAAPNTFEWAEQRCAEALAIIRPVMQQHGIRTSGYPPAAQPAPPTLPANYIDPEHQGETLELLQTFYQACNAEGGTADEIYLRGIRAVLAARPAAPPAPEPAPEPRNPTMDEVLDLAKSFRLEVNDCNALLWLVVTAIAAWGDASAAPPAPEVREVVDMLNQWAIALDSLCNKIVNGECRTVACLHRGGWIRGAEPADPSVATCPELEKAAAMRRAAALLQQQSAPAPAVVPLAVSERLPDPRPESEGGDCDAEGRCWMLSKVEREWRLLNAANTGVPHLRYCFSHWLPAHAIPLPQAGEVEA